MTAKKRAAKPATKAARRPTRPPGPPPAARPSPEPLRDEPPPEGAYRSAAETSPEDARLASFQQLTRGVAARLATIVVLLRDGDDGDQDAAAGWAQDPEVAAWLSTVPGEITSRIELVRDRPKAEPEPIEPPKPPRKRRLN